MRCINPIEAKFIDNAAGIRVKFRLAGVSKSNQFCNKSYNFTSNIFQDKFPPTIYYKIFTHRPIQVFFRKIKIR